MLADAIKSEAYRLSKNRMTLGFSVLAIPAMFIAGGIVFHTQMRARMAEAVAEAGVGAQPGLAVPAAQAVDLFDRLGVGVAQAANGAIMVFLLLAAAALYAGDYRWETWRLISARNIRPSLIMGKVTTFAGVALLAMAVFILASLIVGLAEAAVTGQGVAFNATGEGTGKMALGFGIAWVRIVQYAMLSLLVAVVTRSLLASLFVPVVVGFGQTLLGQIGMPFLGWGPTDLQAQLLMPGLAYDTVKGAIAAEAAAPVTSATLARALLSLGLWTLVPFGLALAWFQRQDLSKE